MLPLVPTLALAFVSFFSSAFVILRIVIPILPPHPLSRRVPPSEFGLPNFRTLSPADKSHIWLAACDILALAIFVWQAAVEYLGGPSGFNIATDPASAIRLWVATTLRQSCLLIVASLTLLHVRLGHPVAFGNKHWMLWAPTVLLAATSTALAGVLAGTGVETFFWGLIGYSATIAILSSVAFACLIGTLVIIRRNLAALNSIREPWPPVVDTEKHRNSFATEDINALRDGSSWITSRASSRCESVSAFSFSTHHTHHSRMPSNASSRVHMNPALGSYPSIPHKSSFWFNPGTPGVGNGRDSPVPPVPPLPAPYRPTTPTTYNVDDNPDPFRRSDPRPRLGSQSSWLTEPSTYQPTLSAWSFPATHDAPSSPDLRSDFLHASLLPSTAVSRPQTPALNSTDVLGGYGYAPEAGRAENGVAGSIASSNEVDVSVYRAIGWLVTIWVPIALSLPYYFTTQLAGASDVTSLLLILSVTLSSPLLAMNIIFRSPLPIPSGLFDSPADPPSLVMRAPSPCSTLPHEIVREYKRSGSVTVVEGRRSGDVWLDKGDAVAGKSKVSRALTLLQPKPKLSVLPPEEEPEDGEFTPPLPIQDAEQGTVPPTPQSHRNAEFGMPEMGVRKKDSKASSYFSGTDESVAFATKIMIAQRHYSTLAMTMVLPPSPDGRASHELAEAATTAVDTGSENKRQSHLRARSQSSIQSVPCSAISPPPSSPLPPTPPTLKNFRAASASKRIVHRKSYSSTADEFSFGPIDNDDTREIDALSAGVLPLLVPGLKVGHDMKITEGWRMSPNVLSMSGRARNSRVPSELGGMSTDFSSPQMHSTPHTRKANTQTRARKVSAHKRNHLSLPSLSLGKDGLHALSTWRNDLNRALENRLQYTAVETNDESRRNTIYGEEFAHANNYLKAVREEDEVSRPTSPARPFSTTGFPETLDVPEGMNTARNSLATLISALDQELKIPPPSAASEVTLFDFDPSQDGVAESTPHESKTRPASTKESIPPVPALPPKKASKRSSIVYIKSDENTAPAPAPYQPQATTSGGFADWSSRAVRPLMPKSKASKLRVKTPKGDQENIAPTPGKGLRPLSLLQDRDQNRSAVPETRPLAFGKGSKKNVDGENVRRESSFKKTLRPLRLGRSETTKQRAILREQEVLPDVVVRPPSDGHFVGMSFNYES